MKKIKANEFPVYTELFDAYNFYNRELFGGKLPFCQIVLSKAVTSYGHFMPESFVINNGNEKKDYCHEIAMNVEYFAVRKVELTLSTLVHEMVHLRTFEEGVYGRGNYHSKKWAGMMEEVGLMPSSTEREGGAKTGQSCSHYIIEGGRFERVTKEYLRDGFFFKLVSRISEEVKTLPLEEAMKMAVKGRPGEYVDEEGNGFKGRALTCGNDEEGKEIVKIIVESGDRKKAYYCDCGYSLYTGRANLKILCLKCGKMFTMGRNDNRMKEYEVKEIR